MTALENGHLIHSPPDSRTFGRTGYIGRDPDKLRILHQTGGVLIAEGPAVIYGVSYTNEHIVREVYLIGNDGKVLKASRGYGIELFEPSKGRRQPTQAEIKRALEEVKKLGERVRDINELKWVMNNPYAPSLSGPTEVDVPAEIEAIVSGWIAE